MKLRCDKFLKIRVAKQSGFSLIELLVATVIGLVLLSGIYQVFLSSDTGYRYNEQLARLQENGRFVLDLITRDIRLAGYLGCGDQVLDTNLLNNPTADLNSFSQGLTGYEATSATAWDQTPDATITLPLGGSDILTVRGALMSKPMATSQEKLATSTSASLDSIDIADNDILLISDCSYRAVFQVTGNNGATTPPLVVNHAATGSSPGNATDTIPHTFPNGSDVFKMQSVSYYVRLNPDDEPTLYRRLSNSAGAEQMIEGVENLQILYGEDTDGDRNVDVYQAANLVADWNDVVAVRIGLLLRSPGEIAKKPLDTATYLVNRTTIDPMGNGTVAAPMNDKRMRQVFVTTVGLRNRLP